MLKMEEDWQVDGGVHGGRYTIPFDYSHKVVTNDHIV